MQQLIRNGRRLLLEPWHRRAMLKALARFHAKQRTVEETVHFLLAGPGKGFYRFHTTQKAPEILALARAVSRIAPRVILEIGTGNSGTLFLWAHLAAEKVITCDLSRLRYKEKIFDAFAPPESPTVVRSLQGDSHDPAFFRQVTDTLEGRPVDFLFLDGDHTEAGVEADYRCYAPLVRPGGLIAFHDIAQRQPVADHRVQDFWKRLKKEVDQTEEFIEEPDQCGFGIGLVIQPASGSARSTDPCKHP